MGALLASFSLAFVSYAPLFGDAVESVVPDVARLLSNSASLAAATSVLAVSHQVNLDPVEAGRRIRSRLALLAGAVLSMAVLFAVEGMTHQSPHAYAVYLFVYLAYLGFAVIDFLRQALRQSKSARRRCVRIGMRLAAVGCVFALTYTLYKLTRLVTLSLALRLFPERRDCTTLFSSPCVFSVTAPAVAVLLICVGLTLPAIVYPISLARRRRWERRSLAALEPLWHDLTTALPDIVLPAAEDDEDESADFDFLLQRMVIEISDGILALRPYRSRSAEEAARKSIAVGTRQGAALVEAVMVRSALERLRADSPPDESADLPASSTTDRGGDLRAETEWLLAIVDAYVHARISRVADDEPFERIGT